MVHKLWKLGEMVMRHVKVRATSAKFGGRVRMTWLLRSTKNRFWGNDEYNLNSR